LDETGIFRVKSVLVVKKDAYADDSHLIHSSRQGAQIEEARLGARLERLDQCRWHYNYCYNRYLI